MVFVERKITMELTYKPSGVCSRLMKVAVDDGKITSIEVIGGCSGNLQGISKLLVGMEADEAITRMAGIRCGKKKTSCPDQLAKALRKCLTETENALHNVTE